MASEALDPITGRTPTHMAVPPERLVHIINQCNLSRNRTCNCTMRGNHLAYAATQGMQVSVSTLKYPGPLKSWSRLHYFSDDLDFWNVTCKLLELKCDVQAPWAEMWRATILAKMWPARSLSWNVTCKLIELKCDVQGTWAEMWRASILAEMWLASFLSWNNISQYNSHT